MLDKPESIRDIYTHLARYNFAANFVSNKIVLDVACGPGYGSYFLLGRGASQVIGGDIYPPAIEVAKKNFRKSGIDFFLLDATVIPFADESFDIVVSLETIEHLEQYRQYLTEVQRVLKPGGIFVCSTPNRWHHYASLISPSIYHMHEFSIEELTGLLQEFFVGVEIYEQGWWRNMEKERLRISVAEKAVARFLIHFPPLYKSAKFLYWYLVLWPNEMLFKSSTKMSLTQIKNDWDNILGKITEQEKIVPLGLRTLTSRTIVAVARKC